MTRVLTFTTCMLCFVHNLRTCQLRRCTEFLQSYRFRLNNQPSSGSSYVGVNNGSVQCDLTLLSQSVKCCVCVYAHLCVRVWRLQLVIMCGIPRLCACVCVCVHALLVQWQAESVCTHNKWDVSEALCCIILYSTPEGRK